MAEQTDQTLQNYAVCQTLAKKLPNLVNYYRVVK